MVVQKSGICAILLILAVVFVNTVLVGGKQQDNISKQRGNSRLLQYSVIEVQGTLNGTSA